MGQQEVKNNVTPLNNEYTLQKNAEKKRLQKLNTFKRRRIIVVFVLAMAAFTIPSIRLFEAFNELVSARAERDDSIVQQASLKAEQARLEKQVQLLQDDDYVAKLARTRFYFSREGETIFTIPDSLSNNQPEETTPTVDEAQGGNDGN